MENKDISRSFIINRVDLGVRVVGYEVFNSGINGGEIVGLTPKQLKDNITAGNKIYGIVIEGDELVLDKGHGFNSMMVKSGIGTLVSTNVAAMVNIVYTVYDRSGDNFKVISSRFGRQTFCMDKVKALMDLDAISGLIEVEGKVVCAWELEGSKEGTKGATEDKKKA